MATFRQVVVEQPYQCDGCHQHLDVGALAGLDGLSGRVVCAHCALKGDRRLERRHRGVPGRSAHCEYERRRRLDHERIRREPVSLVVFALSVVGGYVLVQVAAGVVNASAKAHSVTSAKPPVSPANAHLLAIIVAVVAGGAVGRVLWGRRQSTQAWATGARGERAVAARLDKVPGVIVLHDRRIRGSRANIDHIVISRSGIHVIDAKVVSGGRVSVERRGPLWDRGPAMLHIGGRDCTSFVEGMSWQVEAVQRALRGVPEAAGVPLQSMVVIVGAEWGLLAQPTSIGGVWVGWPRGGSQKGEEARTADR